MPVELAGVDQPGEDELVDGAGMGRIALCDLLQRPNEVVGDDEPLVGNAS